MLTLYEVIIIKLQYIISKCNTIETCFAKVGTGTPACASGNAESAMKNEIQIE